MTELRTEEGQPVVVPPETSHVHARSGGASEPGSFVSALAEAVRENPISAALISMGSVWLFTGGGSISLFGGANRTHHRRGNMRDGDLSRGSSAHGFSSHNMASKFDSAGDAVLQAGSGLGGHAAEAASEAAGVVSSAASQAARGASVVYERVGSAARDAADTVSSTGSSAAHTVSEVVSREADHLQQSLSDFFERQPLALGVLGLGLGAAFAAALPQTQAEDDLLGEASANVKEQAQSLASAQLGRARQLAQRAVDEMIREAKVQGLSDGSVAEMIRGFGEKLTNVLGSAGETAKHEVSTTR